MPKCLMFVFNYLSVKGRVGNSCQEDEIKYSFLKKFQGLKIHLFEQRNTQVILTGVIFPFSKR